MEATRSLPWSIVSTKSRSAVLAEQEANKRQQFRYVHALTPMYQKKNVASHWSEIPVTTRVQLMRATTEQDPFAGRLSIPFSEMEYLYDAQMPLLSPEAAPPLFVGIDAADRMHLVDLVTILLAMHNLRSDDLILSCAWGPDLFSFQLLSATSCGATYSGPCAAELIGCKIMPLETAPTEAPRTIHMMHLLHPTTLICDEGHLQAVLEQLVQEKETLNRLGVRRVILRSTTIMEPKERDQLQQKAGVPLFRMLAIDEIPFFALECSQQQGLHVEERFFAVEFLDEEYRIVPENQGGTLTVTPLFQKATPLLRYQPGMKARGKIEPCACGQDSLRLEYF